MAVVIVMDWPEVSKEQYLAVRNDLDWVTNRPDGGMLHAAGWDDTGFHVVDLWQSPDHFQRFVADKLTGAVAKVGIKTEPSVRIFPAEYLDPLAYNPR
jgi:hypothetical protein